MEATVAPDSEPTKPKMTRLKALSIALAGTAGLTLIDKGLNMRSNTTSLWRRGTVAASLLLASSHLTLAQNAPLLKNPGFETAGQALVSTSDAPNGKAQISGTIAESWSDNTSWADVALNYSLDTTNPHSGHYAQKISVARGFAQFAQALVVPHGYYRAAVWLRADAPLWVSLDIRQQGAPYTSYAARPTQVGTQWTRVETSGFVPQDVPAFLLINTTGVGMVYVDDAELAPSVPQPVMLKPPTTVIPQTFFGLNINHMHAEGNIPWPAVPFGAYRTWDSGIVWAHLEPKRGEFDWAWLDKDVAEAQQRGVQILLTLGFTPTWASSDPNNKTSAYGALGATAPPADINDWKNFVRAVATRYKGRIQGYEIWNEPDGSGFYSGTPAQLVPLEKATREVLREVDPAALVVAPAPSSGDAVNSLQWMSDFLTAGGGQNADVMAVHMYNAAPEDDVQASGLFRALLAKYGLDKKPLWNTETGWGFDGKSTDAEVSALVARAYIIDWASHFSRYYWYAWNQTSQVGIRPDAQGQFTVLTPAARAYAQVQKWLLGTKMLSCDMSVKGVWTTALQRPDGQRNWIVWSAAGPQDFALPASWKVRQQQDLSGTSTALSGPKTITVGTAPVLLTPAKRP